MAKYISTKKVALNTMPGSIYRVESDVTVAPQISLISWNKKETVCDNDLPGNAEAWKLPGSQNHWINISGSPDENLLHSVAERFNIHPLTMEDVVNTDQSPKFEENTNYSLLICKMLRLIGEKIAAEQIGIICIGNCILSFQEIEGDVFESLRTRIREGMSRIQKNGPDYGVYALLDAIVDNYMLAIEFAGEQIEAFEDEIFLRTDPGIIELIRSRKSEMAEFRRYTTPLIEAIAGMRKSDGFIKKSSQPFYKSLFDHLQMVNSAINSYREMLRDQLNLFTALQNNRLADIMKVLTIISTIFIPLTFIAGIYGMNFKHMPELSHPLAYPILLAGMGILSLCMIALFKRRGWLGGKIRDGRTKKPMGRIKTPMGLTKTPMGRIKTPKGRTKHS